LIIPFLEEELFKEHFNSFDYNFFPLTIQDYNLVYFKEIDKTFFDPGKYWANEQILVVYANTKNIDTSKFSLEHFNNNYFDNLRTTTKDHENEINILKNQLNSYEINSEGLNQKIEELAGENKKVKSDLFSKQKQYEELTEQNKKNISNLLYQQNKSEGLNQKIEELAGENKKVKSDLFSKQKQYEELTEQNKKNISNLLYQQNKSECLNQKIEELTNKNKVYKSRKVVRFADKVWKFYYIFKSYPKNYSYILINRIYLKLKRFPKITTLMHKSNNKLNIINKKAALETYKKSQTTNSGLINDSEPKTSVKSVIVKPKTSFKSAINSIKPKYPKDIKVAVILDEFSYNCFKHEFNAIIIEPSNWLEIFEMEKPDLFFCESTWSGVDSKKRPWKGQIYSSVNFKYENRNTLLSILDYCKKNNILTIFWNKEDPTHYEDKVYNFVDTALKFDHIFTTSEECVQRYKKDHRHKSVHCLILAGQPKTNVKSVIVKPEVKLKPATSSIKPKYPKDIKVAVILDEFSYNCFKHEFNAIIIEPSNWLEIFEMEKPDLFFCESTWSGVDSKKRPWKGQIYSSVNFKYENRNTLLSILDYCKKNNILTIFWNKEDPTHYEDKVYNFVDTALKFDHIFTTSEECVQRYKKDHRHKSVHCLMFAGQPKMFNPIEKYDRSTDIVFAGSWYNQHPQRCVEMEKIFDNILDNGYNLKIYDRMYNTKDDPDRIFPEKYRLLTNPTVPFNQIEKVYKESICSLNINTETKSKTMFARRVFELMLCNTLVLSNYSEGMYELFGDNVIFANEGNINLSFCEEKRNNNLYNVLKSHTYSQRFKQILDVINYKYMPTDNSITVYYVINDQSEINDILKHYNSITYVNKRLTLLLSKNIPNHLIKNIYQDYANSEVSVYSLNYLLQNKEVSNTLNKLGSYHGNPRNINNLISNNTPYFIFANLQLKPDFIEKGILHFSYIEENVGITLGNQFLFKKVKDINNVIFHNNKFMDVFNSILKDIITEFIIYTLQDHKPGTQKKLTSETPKIDINDIHNLGSDIEGAV